MLSSLSLSLSSSVCGLRSAFTPTLIIIRTVCKGPFRRDHVERCAAGTSRATRAQRDQRLGSGSC